MNIEPWLILSVSGLVLLILFGFTWMLSIKCNNYSFVDVAWAFSFTPVVIWYGISGSGWAPRRWAVVALVVFWSLRLGTHLARRVAAHHPKEDPRYAVLKERWKGNLKMTFLWFFLAQGLLTWLLMLPAYLIATQVQPQFHSLEFAGLALWTVALVGEAIADAQLASFKRIHPHAGGICQVGLWRYSRHPNYFFQSLLWWGLALMALPVPWGWTAIAAPLAMLHFLLNVTGVPLTEKLAIEKRGDAYRDYQRRTSAFIPWFPKA